MLWNLLSLIQASFNEEGPGLRNISHEKIEHFSDKQNEVYILVLLYTVCHIFEASRGVLKIQVVGASLCVFFILTVLS